MAVVWTAFGGVLAGSAFALGAVYPAAALLCMFAMAATAAAAWWVLGPVQLRAPGRVLLAVAFGLTAFTALQCVPLPLGVVQVLSPAAANVWASTYEALNAKATFVPLSLDPTATRLEVAKGVLYICGFLAAVRLAETRERAVTLQWLMIGIALALAMAGILHPAMGAQRLFGIYKPIWHHGRHLAPILNPNHFAAYLNIAVCLSLGLAVSPRPSRTRILATGVFLVLLATVVWVASRGAVVALSVGVGVVTLLSLTGRTRTWSRAATRLVPWLLMAGAVGLAVFAGSENASLELANGDMSKLALARRALGAAMHFKITGAGRGAFESAFPAYLTKGPFYLFTHPENVAAQWTFEWGLPVTLAAAGGIAFALRPATMLARADAPIGPWSALVALATHNLVDFNAEVPAVALALVACTALVVGGRANPSQAPLLGPWATERNLVPATCLGVALAAGVPCLFTLRQTLTNDRDALREAAIRPEVPRESFVTLAAPALLRHPAEAYLPYLVATKLAPSAPGSAMTWASHALERAPVYPPAHLVLASVLAAEHPAQARLELRLAVEQDQNVMTSVASYEGRLVHNFDEAMQLIPQGAGQKAMLAILADKVARRLPSTAWRLTDVLQAKDPSNTSAPLRAVRAAIADASSLDAAPWCAGGGGDCLRNGMENARRLQALIPDRCEPRALAARLEMLTGDKVTALRGLSNALDRVVDREVCLREYIRLAQDVGDDGEVSRGLQRLVRAGCTATKDCVENLRWASSIERARGNRRVALALLAKAHDRDPSRQDVLADLALEANSHGFHSMAIPYLEALARREPESEKWRQELAKARAGAAHGRGEPLPAIVR